MLHPGTPGKGSQEAVPPLAYDRGKRLEYKTGGDATTERNYEQLAPLYDRLMQGIDYEAWVDYIEEIIGRYRGRVAAVADLACGTGSSSLPWAARGYRTLGIDLSEEMLKIARAKAEARGLAIEFLNQDLRGMQLGLPVDLAVCFQDGFNYITDIQDLRLAFQAVSRNLVQGGLFVFDLNYLPRIMPCDQSVSLVEEDGFEFAWRAEYQESEGLWQVEVAGTIEDEDGAINEYREKHRERVYEPHEIWPLLAESDFTVLNSYQAFTLEQPHDQSPRVVYIAQKIWL